jgi:ribonuclease BN (tRNA processing enzyme)
MDEVTLYNLYGAAASSRHEAERGANAYALKLMIEHLHLDHKMGFREIGKRLGMGMKEAKHIMYPIPEPDWRDVERAEKNNQRLVWVGGEWVRKPRKKKV